MNQPSRKVLIITYYFPPSGGAGVQRTLKFVKYLRQFDWEPVVLTVRNGDYPVYDESLFSEIPAGVKVYRTSILEPYRLYRKFTGKEANESTDIASLSADEKSRRKFSERFSEWVRAAFFIPDARVSWLLFAIRAATRIIREEQIRVIYSSAPPYTCHLIGLRLKRKTGLPWIADFRDSWIGWVSAPQWRPGRSRAIELKMERAVLAEADKLVAVSNGVKSDLLSRHPELNGPHWQILPNGFDRADFEAPENLKKFEKTTIIYVGTLYGPRNPEYLLRALEDLQKEGVDLSSKIALRLVGRVDKSIATRIQRSEVSHLFEIVEYMPHRESLAHLLRAHVSLLIIDDAPANQGILTGKLFEYIGAGNPILALAPPGEAADLILSNKLGWVAPPKDKQAIRVALLKILNRKGWNSRRNQSEEAVANGFERRHQTGQLAKMLDEVTEDTVT